MNLLLRKDERRADLVFLASDAMRGRLTDTPENRITTAFISPRFFRSPRPMRRRNETATARNGACSSAPGDRKTNSSNLLRRSDQWPFLQKGVPSLFFHTGLHPDYRTVFDIPEKITTTSSSASRSSSIK